MDNNNKNLHNIIVDTIENDYKTKKVKESTLLLKQKMCKTHDLIKQYIEKVKEFNSLKSDLEVTKKDANYIKSKYKSVIDETRKLELQIVDDKSKNEKLSNKIKEYEVNIAADKQIIQQLTCKIKELEDECSTKIIEYDLQKTSFKDKIRHLEHELQKSKVMHKRKEKRVISNNSDTKLNLETKSSSDIGINVSLCDDNGLKAKPEIQERSVMTDEFYNIKDDQLFCAKCESHLSLALTPEKICKTMCTYPDLIEKNFYSSSKEVLLSPCLVSNTYPDSTNRNEDVLSRASFVSHLRPCNQYNDSTIDNQKSQSVFHSMSVTMENENDELKNTNITMHTPIATKSSNNLSPISKTCTLFQSMDCAREDFYSNDLLAKHSSSIEEIRKQIRLLKGQMKRFKKLNKKPNINSCHCIMNHNDNILLNSNLVTLICKGIAEYYNKRKKTCSKNVGHIDSEKDKKIKKQRRRRLNKYDKDKNASMWKIESFDERYLQDTLYNKSEDTMRATACDILQSKHKLCINKSNAIPYVNASSKFLNDIDDYDKSEFIFCKENALNSTEKVSVEDNLTMSHLSTDKYDSIEEISNNSLSEDNTKFIDLEMKISSCNSDISINDADIIPKENKTKKKSQNKTKYSDRLFKKIRNLKRKVQTNSYVNKEENIELFSDYDKPMKKLRIAHTPKTSVLQWDIDREDFIHCAAKSKSNLETFQQKYDQQLNAQVLNDKLLTENKEDSINKKCDERSANKYINETNNINDKNRKIQEKNLVSTNGGSCFQNNDNFTLPVMDIESVATVLEFNKSDDVLIEDSSKESMERITVEMSNNRDQLDVSHDNVSEDITKDLKLEKSIQSRSANKYINETNNINDKNRKIQEKNLVSTNGGSCFQNNDNFTLPVMDIECVATVLEFNKSDDVLIEDSSKESMERITVEMSNNRDQLDVSHDNVSEDITKDLKLEKSIPLKTQIIIQSETNGLCKNSKYDTYKFTENLQVKSTDITRKGMTSSVELEYICNTTRDENCNNCEIPKNMDTHDGSMSNQLIKTTEHENRNNHNVSNEVSEIQYLQRDSEIIIENYTNDNDVDESLNKIKNTLGKQKRKVYANDKVTEIQIIEIQKENVCLNEQNKETKFINDVSYDNVEQFQTPMSQLTAYINTKCINRKLIQKKKTYDCTITDRFVKKQLKRLINSAWENSVHYDVIQKLANTCGPRIIAKCIVEFLLEHVEHDHALDKSFTPPAPLMSTYEQKITALLIDLEVSKPTVLHFVQVAIEYKLFKLSSEVKMRVDSLTRMYLVLSRIQKDRERVRIMCCNALYCMNLMSINVLYTVLTSWPEVLPNAEINKEILPMCIAYLIGSQQIQGTPSKMLLKKLLALKTLVSTFYKYAYTKQARDDIVKELMTLLKTKRTNGLDTAIILVAKRGGSSWTYKNIIQSALLPMIINYEHPCIYSAFSLLGKLMRAFPLEDKDNIVQEISEQLCDLIQSGQGTHDQQEGVISALLSLSRQKFDVVAPSIIRWAPEKSLRPIVITQLQAFINTHNRKFWKNYLQRIESK